MEESPPALEVEAAALVLRYQQGDPDALGQLYHLLEVAILAVLLHYGASQPPSTLKWRDLVEQSGVVLAELAQRWRPGGAFLAYFMRAFPGAIARQARRAERSGHLPAAKGERADPEPREERDDRELDGPYSTADLATLPDLERQIVLLRAFEGESMTAIASQLGMDWSVAYRLYTRARARLEGRERPLEGGESIAMKRLVQALHIAADPDRRLPGRAWAMAAGGLKRLEYDQLMGQLEAVGAIYGTGHNRRGFLVERTPAATLARVGIRDGARRRR